MQVFSVYKSNISGCNAPHDKDLKALCAWKQRGIGIPRCVMTIKLVLRSEMIPHFLTKIRHLKPSSKANHLADQPSV